MKKNEEFEIEITDLSVNGEGIGHFDGMTYFVKGLIPGDVARVRCVKVKKTYGYGRILEILSPSKDRVEPKCTAFGRCGGCQMMQMSYPAQLAFKEQMIKEKLIRIGGFSKERIDAITEPIVGMEEPYHFRNKAQYPIGRDKDGRMQIGFYASHSHRIIETERCFLGCEENEAVLSAIKKHPDISVYDEKAHSGLLRHIFVRKGFHTGEVMVCLVVNAKDAGVKESLGNVVLRELVDEVLPDLMTIPGIASIVINYNPLPGNVILGRDFQTLWGKDYITDTIGDLRFHISAPSFYQVNPIQTEKLYTKALEYAALTGEETVWDLYCGIGTISLFLARQAKRVYGIEVVETAVENARENAAVNGIENAEFFMGKAEEVLPRFYGKGKPRVADGIDGEMDDVQMSKGAEDAGRHPDVIVVDPPRKGCDEACLATMAAMSPSRIVYVSCDPATLARDLRYLCDNGYELSAVTPVDQFCHSGHVETVVLMSRVEGK